MILLFWKAVSINVRQLMTDAKGVLVNSEKTLKEISERDKWGIPILLLIITFWIGLPGISLFLVGKGVAGQSAIHPTSPIFGVPFFLGLLVVFIKILKEKGNPLILLKLTGYLVIPYIVMIGLFSLPATITVLVTRHCQIGSSYSPLFLVLFAIIVMLFIISTIVTIKLLITAIRISFPSISKRGALLFFFLTLFILNCVLNMLPQHVYMTMGKLKGPSLITFFCPPKTVPQEIKTDN